MKITPTPATIKLRADVENKLGFEVTCTRDCIILSQELKRFDQRFSLSVSTLRRFFGIIKQNSPLSYTSLNALARYTGAPSYDKWNNHHFHKAAETKKENHEIFKPENTIKDFDTSPATITKTIQAIEQILNQFKHKGNFIISPQKLREINQLTFYLLRINAYPTETWKKLNRTPKARIFSLAFPPMDFLHGVGKPYMEDYLATATSEEEKMFANSLIAAGSIYTGGNINAAVQGLKLIDRYDAALHPTPQARMLGLNLLALKNGIKTKTNQKKGFRKLIITGIQKDTELWSTRVHIFKLRIAEWLILSNDTGLLNEYYNSIEAMKSSQEMAYKYDRLDPSYEIFQAWILYLLHKKDEAIQIIESIDLAKLAIHEERTLSIYYYSLTAKLYSGEKGKSSLKYLDLLIEQTKYHGLLTILNLTN
ncbi:MAG: hypothetical protein CL831_00790 [Crocinitomicaceae bacterium]|nr:hypothetical protein [Crocinitomicaceae bacterium]